MKTKTNSIRKLFVNTWFATLGVATLVVAPRGLGQTQPQLDLRLYAGLSITGSPGTVYFIQYTTDLSQTNSWITLTNIMLPGSPYLFVDTTAPATAQRFYRAVTGATPADMVWIPAGTFTMGSPTNELHRQADEGPQMTVTISQGFWMGKYLVTQASFAAIVTNYPYSSPTLPGNFVTWADAADYCAQLTRQERAAGQIPSNWAYRLPTEAEWEYACRAGTTTRFSYGDDPAYANLAQYVWYYDSSGNQTHSVGLLQPNPWGLYDMGGNVWEWCQDWYGAYPGGSVSDPQGPPTGSRHVLRGGAYYSYGAFCRSAFRDFPDLLSWTFAFGFRVVLSPV